MAKNQKAKRSSAPKDRTGSNKCCSCLLTTLIVMLVVFVVAVAAAMGVGNALLKQHVGVGIFDCFKIIGGIVNTKEEKCISDPATDADAEQLYGELRDVMFLSDSVDMESTLSGLIGTATGSAEQQSNGVRLEGAPSEEGGTDLGMLTELYKEGNVDVASMRRLIDGDVRIEDIYDEQFVLSIEGNGLVKLINDTVKQAMGSENQEIADSLSVRQITFSKTPSGDAVMTLVIQLNVRNMLWGQLGDSLPPEIPAFAIDTVKKAIPERIFISADLTLSESATIAIRINSLSNELMGKAFDIIEKLSGEDIEATINNEVAKAVNDLRAQAPELFELFENQTNGKLNIDAYGMIADMLNRENGAQPGNELTGAELVGFIAGVLGSDAENAVAEKVALDGRYGETDWQDAQAKQLVSAMATSFSLAESYFVNGTDENGKNIISVEDGKVENIDKLFGRVYADASGSLYYKQPGGLFKLFVSNSDTVTQYPVSGSTEYLSMQLHYTYGGKDYTLYRSADKTAIVGISADGDVMNKNGTYTELTTFYVDQNGNVYAAQNEHNEYIECKKEELTVDSIMNIVNSEQLALDDVLQYMDLSALKANGVSAWNNNIVITDIQLAALAEDMLDGQFDESISKAEPEIRYAKLSVKDGHNMLTVGIQVKTAPLLGEGMSDFTGLLGEKLYIELICDVTVGLEDSEYYPVDIQYNDLSYGYTSDLLDTIAKVAPDADLTGTLENAGRSIREVIATLNDNMPLEFGDGEIMLSTPVEIIKPLLLGDANAETISDEQFVGALDNLLGSDSNVGIKTAQSTDSAYGNADWKQNGVNSFVLNASNSFGMKADEFLADDSTPADVKYSVSKMMDIMRDESFSLDSVMDYLDYDQFRQNGFDGWNNAVEISDAELAAIVSDLKDELSQELRDADVEVEYAHVSVASGKSYITIGVMASTKKLIGGNNLDKFMEVIGDSLYAEITVDVTLGATEYAPTKLVINDLTDAETDELIEVIEAIDESIDVSGMFDSVDTTLRNMISDLNESMSISFANGKIVLDKPQNIIYDVVFEGNTEYSADEMTEALSLLATNSDYPESLTAPADDYEQFWNDMLREKYFVTTHVSQLFDEITKGNGVYQTVKSDIDSLTPADFVKADGTYKHQSLADASFKANSAQLTWLIRNNTASIHDNMLSGNHIFNSLDIISAELLCRNGEPGIKFEIVVNTADILDQSGVSGENRTLVDNLLGDRIAIEIMWYENDQHTTAMLNGMTAQETLKVNSFVYQLTGVNLFDSALPGYDQSEIANACNEIRHCIDDNFDYVTESGVTYISMPTLYEFISLNVFPETGSHAGLTEQQSLEVMQTLYNRPVSGDAFDSTKLGYTSKAADVNSIKGFVKSTASHGYEVVGALETVNLSARTVHIYVTVKYDLEVGGDAASMLPESVYLTIEYDASVSASGVVAQSDVTYNLVASEDADALNAALSYLGVDAEGALDQAEEQITDYILDMFGM